MTKDHDYLVPNLIELGYVEEKQMKEFKKEFKKEVDNTTGLGIVDYLVEIGVVTSLEVQIAKAKHFGFEFIHLLQDIGEIKPEIIEKIPSNCARHFRVIPVDIYANSLKVAMDDPSDLDSLDVLHHLINLDLTLCVTTSQEIDSYLAKYYPETSKADKALDCSRPTDKEEESLYIWVKPGDASVESLQDLFQSFTDRDRAYGGNGLLFERRPEKDRGGLLALEVKPIK